MKSSPGGGASDSCAGISRPNKDEEVTADNLCPRSFFFVSLTKD